MTNDSGHIITEEDCFVNDRAPSGAKGEGEDEGKPEGVNFIACRIQMEGLDKILIVSITPYFLEKGNVWFEENAKQISETAKTQSFFKDNTLFLEKGQKANLSEILRKIDELGYEKVLQVSEPGEFSHQGGVIDVFPVNLNHAVRFDFLGNKIENIEQRPIGVKDEKTAKEILKRRLKSQKLFSDLKGIKPGDYLVHLDHGIGRFGAIENNYYILEYASNDRLYVPIGLERKLSRYVGFADPKISRLGSSLWQKTKKIIKEETEKLAKELLEIYARRETAQRPPYLPDDEIDAQLAAGFPYEETPDQAQTMEEIRKDLEKSEPMDRIVCGDVGFGKTEIALRTMVRAVKSGYQTALLCPTTILANQHHQNFKERLKNLPIRAAALSRLQTKKEQKEIIDGLKLGKIDIIIGTHRILSGDINFKNLGLLVIDDEQRFGVRQKEKFKKMRASLDVLSLSATPIPRTLYMALSSLKEVSLIQTPPEGRLAIKTFVLAFKEKTIKEAIENELEKGGQVYYLHNRVETIGMVKKFLEKLVPAAKFGIVHGRLNERELLKVMQDFGNKKLDILLATTIIENGLDIPNVNTLIVADSMRLGLSQAYQIRGRIGRSRTQAFAYFLYPQRLSPLAKQRLQALKEAEELGSGYRIALKDLEIRGAGNILGKEQSGNVNRVGLNLYCQILSEAIERLKTAKPAP
ncbi:MAG: helicase-related protein [Candidatus Wildermuthbacteria bacterium]|nr:helicase-related protein [Candidatus Wildermuthbacteria bacterium]